MDKKTPGKMPGRLSSSAQDVRKVIERRCRYLEQVAAYEKKALANLPKGHLKGSLHGNHWEYLQRAEQPGSKWSYIRKKDLPLARKLAQRIYDERMLFAAESELEQLKQGNVKEGFISVEQIYQSLPQSIQNLVIPLFEPDQQYYLRWKSTDFPHLDFREDAPEYKSSLGERMRSKSEILIADMLTKNHIPYIYEKPLTLGDQHTVHPDFTLLDFKYRKEIYWEHLGMIDDDTYRNRAIRKIYAFEHDGYYPGQQLIITVETLAIPLDSSTIQREIGRLDNCRLPKELWTVDMKEAWSRREPSVRGSLVRTGR